MDYRFGVARHLHVTVYHLLILCAVTSSLRAQATTTGAVSGSISFSDPDPTCRFDVGHADLMFGTIEKPINGTLNVTIDADNGGITTVPSGHSVKGHTVGSFSVSGSHVNGYSIRRSPAAFPSKLVSEQRSSDTIDISIVPRKSHDGGATWSSPISRAQGDFDSGSGSGTFSSFERHYQIGGTIRGISLSTPHATYSTSITLRLSCS